MCAVLEGGTHIRVIIHDFTGAASERRGVGQLNSRHPTARTLVAIILETCILQQLSDVILAFRSKVDSRLLFTLGGHLDVRTKYLNLRMAEIE